MYQYILQYMSLTLNRLLRVAAVKASARWNTPNSSPHYTNKCKLRSVVISIGIIFCYLIIYLLLAGINSLSLSSSQVPGSPIFIMKLASDVRHLEVQVLADEYGNTISIYGRSVNRWRSPYLGNHTWKFLKFDSKWCVACPPMCLFKWVDFKNPLLWTSAKW